MVGCGSLTNVYFKGALVVDLKYIFLDFISDKKLFALADFSINVCFPQLNVNKLHQCYEKHRWSVNPDLCLLFTDCAEFSDLSPALNLLKQNSYRG